MFIEIIKNLPKATKVILLINVVMFILTWLQPNLMQILALYYFESKLFMPHQLLTHIFMHAGIYHILFNMYALILFGSLLEKQLGTQRFCILYFFSAIGSFLLHMAIIWYQLSDVPVSLLNQIQTHGAEIISNGQNYADKYLGNINAKYNGSSVGASGAIMGLLISFATLYPNAKLQIIFIPIGIKAKYFMPIYMLIELFLGVSDFQWDNIAHFAHLGGAIFGALVMFFWMKTSGPNLQRENEN